MELLCVMAALAALFLGSAALTLKARIPAGLAPLVTLSCIVAVLTLAGMAGVLYPAAWAVYALCAAGGVWALLPPKEGKKRYYAQLATPGSVTFWALALAFAVYFFVRQPMATVSDEFSLWATAVKVTKVDNSLYSTASLGTPWAVTQNPGLPLLSYSSVASMQTGKSISPTMYCSLPCMPPCSASCRGSSGVWPCPWLRCCGSRRFSSRCTTTPST